MAKKALVLDISVPLLLEFGLAVALLEAELEWPVEHVETRGELQKPVHIG